MTLELAAALVAIGLVGAFLAGLVGLGGAIVMIPLLLYAPPLLGVGRLEVKAVAGVTMTQVLVAAISGTLAWRRHRAVHTGLVAVGGLAMGLASLAGALASALVSDRALLLVFALMATGAVALMFVPTQETTGQPLPERYSRPLVAAVGGVVGLAAGLVGAGGAFLLVPLLLVVVGVPIRVTIGSSLAITACSAVAGFLGKALTAQIPWMPALAVALGAVPGAQLGAAVSRRLSGSRLRLVLVLVIVASAGRVWWDLLAR